MKFRMNNNYTKWGLTAFCVLAGTIIFYYLIFHSANLLLGLTKLVDIMLPVVLGLITAYLLSPVMNFIEFSCLEKICDLLKIKKSARRGKILRAVSILLTCVLFFSVVYIMLLLFLSQIIPSIQRLVGNFDTYVNNIYNWVNKLMEDYPELGKNLLALLERYSGEVEKFLNETVLAATSEVIKKVSLSIIGIIAALWDFLIGFIIAIYVMSNKEKYAGIAKKMTFAFFEKDTANVIISNCRFVHNTFIGFVGGKLIDSVIIGLLCWIGTTLLQTPYAALISLIIGVTNIIPFFGPFLGAIPSIVLIFIVDPLHPLNAVYFMIFVFFLQQLDGNIIGPKILGDSTGLESFWVIFAITLFGGLWGVPGMIIGVPLFAVIYAAIRGVVNHYLRKKNLPEDTDAYLLVANIDDDDVFETFTPMHQRKKEELNKSKENTKFIVNKEVYKSLKKQQREQKSAESVDMDDNIAESAAQKEEK